jgi:hypothetical protein
MVLLSLLAKVGPIVAIVQAKNDIFTYQSFPRQSLNCLYPVLKNDSLAYQYKSLANSLITPISDCCAVFQTPLSLKTLRFKFLRNVFSCRKTKNRSRKRVWKVGGHRFEWKSLLIRFRIGLGSTTL